jgi:hypothetical protein
MLSRRKEVAFKKRLTADFPVQFSSGNISVLIKGVIALFFNGNML